MAYEINEAKDLVIKAGLELTRAGLVARTWGNISARISDTQFVITPSGRGYETLTRDDIVVVNIDDCSYEGNIKPSGEKGVHAAAYELRQEVQFVIHTHQNYASALSIIGEDLEIEDTEYKDLLGEMIPCADYGMYATSKLINAVKDKLEKYPMCPAILMNYHGALCVGCDYDEAFSVAYALEKASRKIYKKLCGKQILPEKREEQINYHTPVEIKRELLAMPGVESVIHTATPYTVAVSQFGETMYPYLDDLAQIAGTEVKCISSSASASEFVSAMNKRNAVFLRGFGAICTGITNDEAQAVAIVLEKACMAAYLAHCRGSIKPISKYHARKDRKGYIESYSKLK